MMQREELTIDDILALEPCLHYTRARIKTIFAGRSSMRPRDVMNVPDALLRNPWPDRLWLLLRCLAPRDCALVAIRAARLALPFWRARYPDDHRPARAIRAAVARLRGRNNDRDAAVDAYAAYAAHAAGALSPAPVWADGAARAAVESEGRAAAYAAGRAAADAASATGEYAETYRLICEYAAKKTECRDQRG
jgi:hypothetical protein